MPGGWGGGYHLPVCVETVVGLLHHLSVEGGADNSNNNINLLVDKRS